VQIPSCNFWYSEQVTGYKSYWDSLNLIVKMPEEKHKKKGRRMVPDEKVFVRNFRENKKKNNTQKDEQQPTLACLFVRLCKTLPSSRARVLCG
jgi:hypothetical protein